ncbi:hypothetical protein SELMODRAFT_429507 [Selaginella moellendorffii]|uniref:Uncharacterized protein n=1 Tax=Selaginella moellendorffii TaxID=88036 RepID=D8T6E4_SELML|nr:hypothetical protein SELMODRAFT_429507 [Selaginella moellendorffii]
MALVNQEPALFAMSMRDRMEDKANAHLSVIKKATILLNKLSMVSPSPPSRKPWTTIVVDDPAGDLIAVTRATAQWLILRSDPLSALAIEEENCVLKEHKIEGFVYVIENAFASREYGELPGAIAKEETRASPDHFHPERKHSWYLQRRPILLVRGDKSVIQSHATLYIPGVAASIQHGSKARLNRLLHYLLEFMVAVTSKHRTSRCGIVPI